MTSLDTNVVVRVLTADDPVQLAAATAVMEKEELWLSKTVLLETEWVLRFSYELSRSTIHQAFGRLVGLENMQVEDRGAVLRALGWYGEGMDFADSLHLASTPGEARFATFDQALGRAAARPGTSPPVAVLCWIWRPAMPVLTRARPAAEGPDVHPQVHRRSASTPAPEAL